MRLRKLDIYYSYQCEKNVELYMLNKAKYYYPVTLANEWDFIYDKDGFGLIDTSIPIEYPEKRQRIIKTNENKYQKNFLDIFGVSIEKRQLSDINKDIIPLLQEKMVVGINLDYFYLVDDYEEHYVHSLLITNYKDDKLYLVDPKRDEMLTEWMDFEKIYSAYYSEANNRQYYTCLSIPQHNPRNQKKFITKAMSITNQHLLEYLESEQNGIIPLKKFFEDIQKLPDLNIQKSRYILELIYSLLISVLNQRNNYNTYIKLLMKKTGDLQFEKVSCHIIALQKEWDNIRDMFYKVKELDGKRFIKNINLLFPKFEIIIKMEQSFIELLYNTINLNLERG
jgi:hypothetical protein